MKLTSRMSKAERLLARTRSAKLKASMMAAWPQPGRLRHLARNDNVRHFRHVYRQESADDSDREALMSAKRRKPASA